MRPQSVDTDPEAEKVQIELLRQASISRRIALALSLSETVIQLARNAIRIQNPNFSDRDVLLRFVSIHYGQELAESVRKDLQQRSE
jgi:hypothetical protein